MDIHLSNGRTETDCSLVVRNVTGIAAERGFRLYWTNDGRYLTPALGYATSNPFRREREAIAYGERHFGERAKRIPA